LKNIVVFFVDILIVLDSLKLDLRQPVRVILTQLKTEERMDSLESMLREHISACERAKA